MITISCDDRVPEAFHILVKNNIYSAPVVNNQTQTYYGFVDLLDIVILIVKIVETQWETQGKTTPNRQSASPDLFHLLEQVEAFDWTTVDQITDLAKRNPFCPIRSKESIEEALKVFANTGAHKIPVLQNPWTVENVLTHSAIIAWLDSNILQLGAIKDQTVRSLGISYKPVVSVSIDSPTIMAFRLMAQKRISSVAVVDENGLLLANLSAKDIKVLEPDALFTKLYSDVSEYLTVVHERDIKSMLPAIYCHENSTLQEVIHKLAKMKIHRLYVIDDHKMPIGVISLGDVLGALLQEKEIRNSK